VVALCDLVPERLAALGNELGVTARYSDLDAMIRETQPDIVAIPTGTEFHYPLCRRVLEYGVHIDVEKPICTGLVEADELIAVADAKGVRIAVHHQSRVGRSMRAAKAAIAAGRIGAIRHLDGSCKGYYAGYGMMNIGTHFLNNCMELLGPCRTVSASSMTGGRPSRAEDVVAAPGGMGIVLGERVTALLTFDGGVAVTAQFHRFCMVDNQGYHFEILGDEGRILWKTAGGWLLPTPHFVPDGTRDHWEPLALADPEGFEPGCGADPDEWAYVTDLVGALDEGRAPTCSGAAARHALEINFGIFESAAYGVTVNLPQERRDHPLLRWRAEKGIDEPPAEGPRPYAEWLAWEDARIGRG
jgi:predicted dehydrogenase